MKRTVLKIALLLAATQIALVPATATQTAVPAEVQKLEGTYTGSWTMFGIDAAGKVVKKMAWTDTVTASGAAVSNSRAFVNTVAVMTFEGGHIPPYTLKGLEGYQLKQDGSLGGYFIETFGQTKQMTRVGKNVWSYSAKADASELGRLGFPTGASGQHVMVKVVSDENGIETHRIDRLTHVTWEAANGETRRLSFVSLKGHHKRQQ